jgi:hypothetical protein
VQKLIPILLPEAKSCSLDFHPIPYCGEESLLENHYIPCRGQACPSIQTFFVHEHEKQVFCSANANFKEIETPNQQKSGLNLSREELLSPFRDTK